ncbi:MAG: FkbM family methyltransferase [Bacteroidetes bacterium]|nr:FkbM family methyltransferase [Bacteroidota bacterium]
MKRKSVVKQFLFKHLKFETYLLILSKLYFISYRLGILKFSKAYTYHYALKQFIKSGDTVIDIGANLGYYSVLFSRWVKSLGKVFAVEPVIPVFNTLKKNTSGLGNITLLNFALGDENKSIRMANESKEKYGYITTGTHFVYSDSHTQATNIDSLVFF